MKHLCIIFLCCFVFISCKKKEEDSNSCSTCPSGGGTEPVGFYYNINGAGTITADSAFFYPSTKIIIAYKGGMTKRIIIKTTAQLNGTYGFTTTANTLSYIEPLGSYNATSGYVNITDNSNNKLSGNFSSGGGGVASSVSGNFSGISKK